MYKKVIYKSKEEAAAALQKMVQRKREWVEQAEKELKEIEAFFRSDWFAVLTRLDPDLLIKKLRKEKRNYDG